MSPQASPGRSPRSGDRVSAKTDDRDGRPCEGVLYLRHVPSPLYVQVDVWVGGRPVMVRADSIEILVGDEVPVEELEALDPLVGQPGRRRIHDLAEAEKDGLLQPSTRLGGPWDDLFRELERRAQPMLEAGWRLVDTLQEESWEYGDSVFYGLERDGVVVELNYYEHGQLVAYPVLDEPPEDDVTEPFFSIHGSTPETALAAFCEHGFIDG